MIPTEIKYFYNRITRLVKDQKCNTNTKKFLQNEKLVQIAYRFYESKLLYVKTNRQDFYKACTKRSRTVFYTSAVEGSGKIVAHHGWATKKILRFSNL